MRTKPFDWVTERARSPLFAVLTVLLIITSIRVFDMDRVLVGEAAPFGADIIGGHRVADALQTRASRA